jgi:hypothetical protein
MAKLCTNKNHSYKHNEQIKKQNIDNSECFGVQFVKIYPEMWDLMWWRGIKECKECWNQEMCILPGKLANKRLE